MDIETYREAARIETLREEYGMVMTDAQYCTVEAVGRAAHAMIGDSSTAPTHADPNDEQPGTHKYVTYVKAGRTVRITIGRGSKVIVTTDGRAF